MDFRRCVKPHLTPRLDAAPSQGCGPHLFIDQQLEVRDQRSGSWRCEMQNFRFDTVRLVGFHLSSKPNNI